MESNSRVGKLEAAILQRSESLSLMTQITHFQSEKSWKDFDGFDLVTWSTKPLTRSCQVLLCSFYSNELDTMTLQKPIDWNKGTHPDFREFLFWWTKTISKMKTLWVNKYMWIEQVKDPLYSRSIILKHVIPWGCTEQAQYSASLLLQRQGSVGGASMHQSF